MSPHLPLRQVTEAGQGRQTAEDPGELGVLGHLQGGEGEEGDTSSVTVR